MRSCAVFDPAATELYTFPYTTLFRSLLKLRSDRGDAFGDAEGACQIGQALTVASQAGDAVLEQRAPRDVVRDEGVTVPVDRKSTRLNSSHLGISYAVFCLKKKNDAAH